MKRMLAALLCALMLLALLPAFASAEYSTVSNRGVELQYPAERDFFVQPIPATIKYFEGGTGIYFMPMPEKGHGNLGTVRTETTVMVLAEKNGFLFFVTGEGHYGWSWNEWFEFDAEKLYSGKLGGKGDALDYPLFSSYGYRLDMPKDDEYFDEPMTMTVAELSSGRIHLMPMPSKGHGNLGVVESGETVEVLAERGRYYFFRTADGRCGWNGSRWFEG